MLLISEAYAFAFGQPERTKNVTTPFLAVDGKTWTGLPCRSGKEMFGANARLNIVASIGNNHTQFRLECPRAGKCGFIYENFQEKHVAISKNRCTMGLREINLKKFACIAIAASLSGMCLAQDSGT